MSDAARPSIWSAVNTWAEMIKFAHSVFALPFALAATFMAGRHLPTGRPTLVHLTLIIVCMVAARSVAMTFNRIVDARIDARNPRTANRPMPAGRITPVQAWMFLGIFFVTFALGCFSFFVLFDNPWPMWLGGPVLVLLCGYSFAKRFTRWSHFWLGLAIGLSPPAAWLAIDPASVAWPAVLLAGAVMLWIGGFDVIYACQDVDVDRRDGLFSMPARWGVGRALAITRLAHALVVVMLVGVGVTGAMGGWYYGGVGAVALLLLIENLSVSPSNLTRVNLAFFTINGVVGLVFGACAIVDCLLAAPGALR